MRRLEVDPTVWDLFPDARIGVLLVDNLDNQGRTGEKEVIFDLLDEANLSARKHLREPVLSQNPAVAVWREAFAKFKTKKGVRSSIEALLKRVEKGNEVGNISPLVDLYDSVSLEYAIPCGMEDLDAVQGNLRLTVTEGGDPFFALGDTETTYTLPGEIAYLDDEGAVCRCWNWRDGQRTMITEGTKRAVAVMELPDARREADLKAALGHLRTWIEKTKVGSVTAEKILSKEDPFLELV